ncbi:MAG TPA: hypothetical protein VHN80_30305, partial [Kineosporiaceae bacterium]|nr:hypothetical protein [Kineosporiaceae bacterium]
VHRRERRDRGRRRNSSSAAATTAEMVSPASLATAVREHAHEAGLTISAVVAAALLEFLRRPRSRRSRR